MARSPADEISILRFFETEPIEKAELLYKIVAEKMCERLGRDRKDTPRPSSRDAATRRRRTPTDAGEPSQLEGASAQSAL